MESRLGLRDMNERNDDNTSDVGVGDVQSNYQLNDVDSMAVDMLLEQGRMWDASNFDCQHQCQCAKLLALMSQYPCDEMDDQCCEDLIARTMFSIKGCSTSDNFFLRFRPITNDERVLPRQILPFTWRDAISVAAVAMMLISVGAPMMASARNQATRQSCASNMMSSAAGFTQFAGDYEGSLPSYYSDLDQQNWLTSKSNSVNLLSMSERGYVSVKSLSCPDFMAAIKDDQILQQANWTDQVTPSYAYQNQFGTQRSVWNCAKGSIAVIADRNPHVDACCPQSKSSQLAIGALSPCHGGDRENMLVSDGSVQQSSSPYLGNDHIWLPNGFEDQLSGNQPVNLTGTEIPADRYDTMLIQ